MCGSDEVLTFPCSFSPFALFFSANRKNYYQLNPHIFFENTRFAKINTRKKQSKHHSQKFVPAKIYTNKVYRDDLFYSSGHQALVN